jgi:hypothetical protein
MSQEPAKRILCGARAIAGYVFDDEEQWRRVYSLKDELGLFRLGGQVCGRPSTIDARIAARETSKSDVSAAKATGP